MTTAIEQRSILTIEQMEFRQKMLNPMSFWLFTLMNVPAGWIAGMRLRELDTSKAVTSIPFKFLNKNPFKSIYFAVQSMAAELSTAALVLLHIQGQKPSIAYIIVDLKASFTKKATGRTYFTCEGGDEVQQAMEQCVATGEPTVVHLKTTGKMKDGTVVSEFTFSWSMKQRSR
ncbi:thioesterase [Reichenbachiella sp. MALMAid0571]|uniref:thioesterase n=1 Tax=Reichenbachiella sp. MALMAid0571 TaxID=3143939 RepID=UPI0032DEB257